MVLYWKKIGLGRCRRSHICDDGGDGDDGDDADESSVMMLVIMVIGDDNPYDHAIAYPP